MSYWTHVFGTIKVSPAGRTQAEKAYILQTVLDHLPNVTGSERDMHIHVIQSASGESLSSSDEFGMTTDNLVDRFGHRDRDRGWLRTIDDYIIVVEGNLRDRQFDQTYREFQKWLCRLAKRVSVHNVVVTVSSYNKVKILADDFGAYYKMNEDPSWCNNTGEPAWWEHLMWNRYKGTTIPIEHVVKYYDNTDADAKWQKQISSED